MDSFLKGLIPSPSKKLPPKRSLQDNKTEGNQQAERDNEGAKSEPNIKLPQKKNDKNNKSQIKSQEKVIPEKMKNFFSQLLQDTLDQQERQNNPELIRVRNNLLILLLVLCAYGVYYLIGDFVDILLTAYIAGIAYQQMRDRFCGIVMSVKSYRGYNQSFIVRLFKAIGYGILAFVLPRMNYMLSHPQIPNRFPSLNDYLGSIQKNKSMVVFFCEILIMNLFKKNWEKLRPTNVKFVRFIFAVLILTLTICAIIVIPSVMYRQVSSVGFLAEQKLEQKLGCQVIAFDDHNSNMPYCSEKITSENEFIRQTVEEFRNQNQTIERCMDFVSNIQMDYLGNKVFDYEEIACTWYTFLEKAGNYSGFASLESSSPDLTNMVFTGTNIFKTFFGNLASILGAFSNFIFNFTTFVTMFMLTIQYNNQKDSAMKQLFSQNKQQLISSITNLIQATFFIVIEHFVVSIVLLEIFGFTSINLLISTLLSSMAFFPFFRPWFGILLVAFFRALFLGEYYISLSFVALYYIISEKIYSFHYRKMQIHEIITNMSVLFGIYRFGIAGIFYGPLIIILYKFIEKELLMKELARKPIREEPQ